LTIKDAPKPFCGKIELYPISSEIISYAKSARMAYKTYLENLEARKADQEKGDKKQCEKEERLALTKRFEEDDESIDALEKEVEEKKAELSTHGQISDSLPE